ncbi:MAG: uroporphyrinogen-III C-methyltransferase [Acidimicrobiales bacterium]
MTVHLVGAGPGDPQLLTLRAARLLEQAQVVVHDRLVSREILQLVGPLARVIDVGKTPGLSHSQARINELLVRLAHEHEVVVRLKGGDPFVFGRGGEECEALHAAGVAVQVVPGITSALAGPLLAGVPVTHRGLSHGVTIVTGTTVHGAGIDFRALANADITLVVLMGVQRRGILAAELQEAGLSPETAVAVIERASTPHQRTVRCRLGELADATVTSPAVIVIGAVASLELNGDRDAAIALDA